MAAPPPWVILRRRLRLVPEGAEAERPAAISVALREPPRVTILDVSPRVHPGGRIVPSDKLPYLVATGPSALLLGFSAAGEAPAIVPDGLVLARHFASPAGDPALHPATGSAELVPRRTGPSMPATYNVSSVGLTASMFGGYLIAELEVPKGSDTAKLLRLFSFDTLSSGDADQWVETELPFPLHTTGGREWCPSGVVDHAKKLWWFDLSWGLLSCDPSGMPLALRFHDLPPGRDAGAEADPSVHATRFIGVSDSWLRYVDIAGDGAERKVAMWTWMPETGGGGSSGGDHSTAIGWQNTYEMSFDEIWNDSSYRDTHLLRMIPDEIVLVSPRNPDEVYFFLQGSLLVVDVPAHRVMGVVKDWPYRRHCILPWDLPPSIAKAMAFEVGELSRAREEAAARQQQRPWQELPDDVLEEVLLRVPPDPVTLVRAAAVCRGWCRIFSDARFHGRFARHHRLPPLLGFVANVRCGGKFYSRFVPTTNRYFPRRAELDESHALDARNGRVLLTSTIRYKTPKLEVWDPITDEFRELPQFPRDLSLEELFDWNAALLCARHGHGECNIDCRGGAFRVVLLDSESEQLRVHLYSSEHDVWSDPEYGPPSPLLGLDNSPPALTASGLYFADYGQKSLVRYDLDARGMVLVPTPREEPGSCGVLTTSEAGGLGLARIVGGRVVLWSYVETGGGQGAGDWQQMGYVDLNQRISWRYIGFAHGPGVFFVPLNTRSTLVIYSAEDVRWERCGDGITDGVVPYTSFYIPVHSSASSWRREDVIGRERWEALMRAVEEGNMVIDEEKEDLEALTAQQVG